jgi:hypothetical protein
MQAALRQLKRSTETGEPSTDHSHIAFDGLRQCRIPWPTLHGGGVVGIAGEIAVDVEEAHR